MIIKLPQIETEDAFIKVKDCFKMLFGEDEITKIAIKEINK